MELILLLSGVTALVTWVYGGWFLLEAYGTRHTLTWLYSLANGALAALALFTVVG